MKEIIKENSDVLGLNSVTYALSFTAIEQTLQIILLIVSIGYTLERFFYYRNKKKNEGL
tara:strand:+ start:117 stop:293 length:177 start_codon:yes stop_codon:yes gene_type:complete